MLQPELPPYSVEPATFQFPALAALAGKLQLGSGREAAVAALLAARLARDAADPDTLDRATREARAAAARDWFRALCPDARIRAACTAVADATGGPGPRSEGGLDTAALARAIQRVSEVTSRHLDAAARRELEALARRLQATP